MGSSDDELCFRTICKRESYITQFTWAASSTRMANPIFKCRVTPNTDAFFNETKGSNPNYFIQPSAMSFCASTFAYWHGSITYRLDFVVSDYHRGKVVIGFEPNIAQFVLINADIDLNKNFLIIVDLQETQSVSFCINWAQPRAWLRTLPAGASVYNYGNTFSLSYSYEYVNGYFFVTPLTELTSPNASSVQVLVYAWSDDIIFQQPDTDNIPLNRKLVSEGLSSETNTLNDVPVSCVTLNKAYISLSGVSQLHFGEQILSFRSLLHRYATTQQLSAAAGANGQQTLVYHGNNVPSPFPTYTNSTTTVPALIQYLPYAFIGVRGGIRKRIHVLQTDSAKTSVLNSNGNLTKCCVTLAPISNPSSGSVNWTSIPSLCDYRGSVSFVPGTNGGIEYEIPYYSINLFHFAFNSNGIGQNALNDMSETWITQHIVAIELEDSSFDTNTVVVETSIGDDFTYFKYNGAPFYKVIVAP